MRHHPRTCAITRAHAPSPAHMPPPARRARLVGRAGHLPPSPSISLHLPPFPSHLPPCAPGSPQAAPRMATWRARSRWHRCAASGCSLAGPSSSSAAPRLRWRRTALPCARACGGRWQTRSEAAPLAWPRPVAPPVCCAAPRARRPRRVRLRSARLWAQLARTAACAARWLHGVHPAGAFGTQEPCLMHAWRSDWNVSRLPCFDAARFAPAVLRHLTDPLHETSQCFR